MGNRRFTQMPPSDDEDDGPPPPPPPPRRSSANGDDEKTNQRKRKKMKLVDEAEDEEKQVKEDSVRDRKKQKKVIKEEEATAAEPSGDEEEAPQEDAKPIGDVIRASGKGRGRRNHYEAFEYDGMRYDLEDPVLLVPEEANQKPYVAIIKDISQTRNGSLMVTGQWFYRPEEAEKKSGGNWQSTDTRELFYSFHRDEVPAESVMHKCVVHFIPLNKQIPPRKQHPGFIVQRVYDTEQRRLFKLTDKDYEDNKQEEIELLVQKTMSRLGDLPDIEPEEAATDQEHQLRNKRLLRKKSMTQLDVSREDEASTRSGQSFKAETPGSCASNASEYYTILSSLKALTGETQRDKWLERLLQSIQFICTTADGGPGDGKGLAAPANGNESGLPFHWPDSAVAAIAALEKASHEALSSDFQKYNQKMRQLAFNLKNNAVLAGRLLKGELEPSQILSMTPNELKEGLTAEEIASRKPEESEHRQMTDARCKRCKEKKVVLIDIIQTGHGDRYQLECNACGNNWYASSDEVSTLTIDEPSSARTVGTVPLATAKFEDVEKKLVSPRRHDKSADDGFKKTSEAFVPVLDSQK
ncbi:uncharacterized protein LOC113779147 isoform X2 [Coffea eugenioides]|uniref:uncharacterized protein LOC113779147 isoform X2 n=1 Tax=Coffea eugenioides TaxID=49369 RepID=UPI000F60B73F|nr:uncharacterized protein LOC113779147 isoform X2 [Coffea eugenioides]